MGQAMSCLRPPSAATSAPRRRPLERREVSASELDRPSKRRQQQAQRSAAQHTALQRKDPQSTQPTEPAWRVETKRRTMAAKRASSPARHALSTGNGTSTLRRVTPARSSATRRAAMTRRQGSTLRSSASTAGIARSVAEEEEQEMPLRGPPVTPPVSPENGMVSASPEKDVAQLSTSERDEPTRRQSGGHSVQSLSPGRRPMAVAVVAEDVESSVQDSARVNGVVDVGKRVASWEQRDTGGGSGMWGDVDVVTGRGPLHGRRRVRFEEDREIRPIAWRRGMRAKDSLDRFDGISPVIDREDGGLSQRGLRLAGLLGGDGGGEGGTKEVRSGDEEVVVQVQMEEPEGYDGLIGGQGGEGQTNVKSAKQTEWQMERESGKSLVQAGIVRFEESYGPSGAGAGAGAGADGASERGEGMPSSHTIVRSVGGHLLYSTVH